MKTSRQFRFRLADRRPSTVARTAAVALVVLAVIAAAYVGFRHPPQLFAARADLYFLLPRDDRRSGNAFDESQRSVLYYAGLVEREWDRGHGYPDLASPIAPLWATGLQSAVTVTLPNNAGQFERSYNYQKLIVQTVDPTLAGAQRLLDDTLAELRQISTGLQDGKSVRLEDQITTYVTPSTPTAGAVRGNPTRSVLGVVGIGVILVALLNSRRRRGLTDDVPVAATTTG